MLDNFCIQNDDSLSESIVKDDKVLSLEDGDENNDMIIIPTDSKDNNNFDLINDSSFLESSVDDVLRSNILSIEDNNDVETESTSTLSRKREIFEELKCETKKGLSKKLKGLD